MKKVFPLVFAGALVGYVSAAAPPTITSLYIPDTDPQSLSVDVLGVGPDGATTYFIQPIGTESSSPPETLVANANHASLHASITGEDIVFTDDCAIGSDLVANCTVVAVMSGTTTTDFEVETATPIPVVLGSVAPSGNNNPSPSAGSGSNSTATPGSSATPGSIATPGSTAASPPLSTSPAGNGSSTNPPPNGAMNVKSTTKGLITLVALTFFGVSML